MSPVGTEGTQKIAPYSCNGDPLQGFEQAYFERIVVSKTLMVSEACVFCVLQSTKNQM